MDANTREQQGPKQPKAEYKNRGVCSPGMPTFGMDALGGPGDLRLYPRALLS